MHRVEREELGDGPPGLKSGLPLARVSVAARQWANIHLLPGNQVKVYLSYAFQSTMYSKAQ